jgi:hypothetical protein
MAGNGGKYNPADGLGLCRAQDQTMAGSPEGRRDAFSSGNALEMGPDPLEPRIGRSEHHRSAVALDPGGQELDGADASFPQSRRAMPVMRVSSGSI